MTKFLLSAERDYFLYRDFQSRNVLWRDGHPYFVDYQGGRRGALQYDIASLLYDGKADLPPESSRSMRSAGGATEADLIEHCRSRLSHFKCPTSVEVRDSLPRTATGKLQKFKLREPYWLGLGRKIN